MVTRRLTGVRARATRIRPRSIARWWPLGILVLLAFAVALFERSATWGNLDGGLRSLDFDPERAQLIEAWLAGALFAFGGAIITGRPWLSSIFAVGFVGLTYTLPLGARLVEQTPTLFGIRERVSAGAIQHNRVVALAVAFLIAVVAAAVADLLGREVRRHLRERQSRTRAVRSAALGGALIFTILLAGGVDPLLRVGPDAGVYSPAPVVARPVSAAGQAAPTEPVPSAGEVAQGTYYSAAMRESRHFYIYLPPSYALRSAAHRHYPTIYLLHGDPSNSGEWLRYGTPAVFDTGFAQGDLSEAILVMPDGNGHVTVATQWANRRDGRDRIEDATLELVAYVDQQYRTAADRQYRIIGGLSSGAYGAVNIAARHPDVFGVAMGFSGYYVARGPVFGVDRPFADSNSPTIIVQRSAAARTVHYILTVGAGDPYRASTEGFVQQLRRLGVTTDFELIPGGGHGGRLFWEGLLFGLKVIEPQLAAMPAPPNPTRG
ncbi:MAG TPA: alpha/beta hydrolase-fold protein [Candidatus Dormibacteraeota bacterium]|nr:alpha/beta hydrolase-fold protein [Candidatus Dormibacteraeota bacterium]